MPQMNTEGVVQRKSATQTAPKSEPAVNGNANRAEQDHGHPVGPPIYGLPTQVLRIVLFTVYFLTSCLFIHGAQLLGLPLYVLNREWFYEWRAHTKEYFGMLLTTGTFWWSPTTIRVSGDKSMAGQLKQNEDGRLEVKFPERVVLIANHQLYTDWVYLWWTAYANDPPMHGHIYIILKESLKYVPVIGTAMMLYGFVFMARKWASDQMRLKDRLSKLATRRSEPISAKQEGKLDPMWLLLFPEGTNLSANTRAESAAWAAKKGIEDNKHQILPRSTGLQFCLSELKGTVEYVYDCTIAYEGVPPGGYGPDIFTLRSVYFQGRPPKSVNMYWRRFAVKDIPVEDSDKMYDWILQRWREKDDFLSTFLETGKFPGDKEAVTIKGGPEDEFKTAYISTSVRPRQPLEFLEMFMPVVGAVLAVRILVRELDKRVGKGAQPLAGGFFGRHI